MPIHSRRRAITPIHGSLYDKAAGGGGGYTAQGVLFDGTNDFLSTNGVDLTGNADGKQGIVSFWFKVVTDGSGRVIHTFDSGFALRFLVAKLDTAGFRVFGLNAAGTIILQFDTTTAFGTGQANWAHFLASWNLATTTVQLYINDVSDLGATTATDDTIKYAVPGGFWGIGASPFGGDLMNCNFADLYFNTATSLDLTNSTNRRKFISAGLAPVDLGATGATPTGSAPLVYLSGSVASWHTNKNATAGGFDLNGTLTASATNPP